MMYITHSLKKRRTTLKCFFHREEADLFVDSGCITSQSAHSYDSMTRNDQGNWIVTDSTANRLC